MTARHRFAVIGAPVAHSLSPLIFSALFDAAGLSASYHRREVRADELGAFVRGLRTDERELDGLSVTLPHKEAILALLDEVSPLARRVGAVNTVVVRERGTLWGTNTDVEGVRRALESTGADLTGARWLVLGAGGAARAAVVAALDSGARSVAVHNRSPARAADLARELAGPCAIAHGGLDDDLLPALERCDVVVNATALGLRPDDESPLPAGARLGGRHTVLDTVYGAHVTPLETAARAQGARFACGRRMLVEQALVQFEAFVERSSPIDAAEVMQRLGFAPR